MFFSLKSSSTRQAHWYILDFTVFSEMFSTSAISRNFNPSNSFMITTSAARHSVPSATSAEYPITRFADGDAPDYRFARMNFPLVVILQPPHYANLIHPRNRLAVLRLPGLLRQWCDLDKSSFWTITVRYPWPFDVPAHRNERLLPLHRQVVIQKNLAGL